MESDSSRHVRQVAVSSFLQLAIEEVAHGPAQDVLYGGLDIVIMIID